MKHAPKPLASRLWTAAAALSLALGGCALTIRNTVPQPVVEPPPPSRIEAAVGVRLEPGMEGREDIRSTEGFLGLPGTRYVTAVGRAVVSLCDAFLPRLFARTKPVSGTAPPEGVDALLDVRLASFDLAPAEFPGPATCRAHLVVGWDLTAPDGEPIASFATDVVGVQPQPMLGRCVGEAVALALQDAGRSLAERLLSDPAVRAWMERRGIATAPAPPPPTTPPIGAEDAGESPPAPTPVAQRAPLEPRSSAFRVGIGAFSPRGTPGALEKPSGGVAFLLGAMSRPLRPLGIDGDFIWAFGQFSSSTAPPPGLFETKAGRMDLTTAALSVGVRGIAPLGGFEPWAGGGLVLMLSKLALSGATLGLPGSVDESGITAGGYLATGLDLALGPKWIFGGQCRWTFAQQSFGKLSAGRSGSIGGLTCLGALSYGWP